MRRYNSSWVLVASYCVAFALDTSASFGGDDDRTSLFRELTSDQTAPAPARLAPAGQLVAANANVRPASPVAASEASSQAPRYKHSPVAQQTVRPASFYGGNSSRQAMSQFPRRAAIQSNPQRATRRQPKPFETAEHEPTISPYLNLDRDENDPQDIPNYLTMVLPQLQQMQTNRIQQREIQQLRGQLQNMSPNAGAGPVQEVGLSPRMGSSARFMDTAQFYGGMR
jgi:hypothetical protein